MSTPLPAENDGRRFLRYDEAAEHVFAVSGARVSTNLVRRWVRHGAPSYDRPDHRYYLQARRINRAIVVVKDDLIMWLTNPDINLEAGQKP